MTKVFIRNTENYLARSIEKSITFINADRYIKHASTIFLKPNLTFPQPKNGVTTSPEFMEAVIKVLSSYNKRIIIGESDGGYRSWSADLAFNSHRLPEVCKKYGVKLVNLSKAKQKEYCFVVSGKELRLQMPAIITEESDFLITLPVPKVHQVTVMSGAIKNQWGCIPNNMRLLYHPYFDELILRINDLVRTKYAIADGKYFLNRTGPMYGDPIRMDLILASDSIGALDFTICKLLGFNLNTIRYLNKAAIAGYIPDRDQIKYNNSPEIYLEKKFFIKRTLKQKIVGYAFDRNWAVNLIWNSWLGEFAHKIMYAISGNPVKDSIRKTRLPFDNH